jgi:OmpA-OmpF porin, OOP family
MIQARLFFLCFLFSCTAVFSQKKKAIQDSITKAPLEVVVTNSSQVPSRDEQVLFISSKSGQQYSGRTNSSGKFALSLPAGDTYQIKLKTLNDTTSYSQVEIPALEPGQFFETPFTVNIEYEPARTYTLDNVHFDTGKPTLRADSFAELDEIAAYMKLKPEQRFEIAGHTDNKGSDDSNRTLSQKRAESVKNYLVKKGINPSRLQAKGYGPTQPVADNSTEEGRQKNRRTEVSFL